MKYFDQDSVYETKQHLGLSIYAWSVLEADRTTLLANMKRDPFLNLIIQNCMYLQMYPANLGCECEIISENYAGALTASGLKLNTMQTDIIMSCLKNAFVQFCSLRTTEKPFSPSSKKINRSFNLTEDVAYNLAELKGLPEELIFKSPGKYIHTIFESYARLPFLDREKILFVENIEELQANIKNGRSVYLQHSNGSTFDFIPYLVSPDIMGSYWYVAGIRIIPGAAALSEQRKPVSFRISRITSIKRKRSCADRLTSEEKEMLDTMISKKGIQYLVGDFIEARIRLTPFGQQKFANQLFMRPAVKRVVGDIYEFEAAENQLEYYFFSFGSEAEVLEPLSLRKRFQEKYKLAYEAYSGSSPHE